MTTTNGEPLLSLFLSTSADFHIPRGTTGDVAAERVGPVMVVRRDESLPRVFRKLTMEGFLSAPVLDGSRFVGFIDIMDLVTKTRDLFWGDTADAWVNFWDKEQKFAQTTVADVMQLPSTWNRDPSPPLENSYTTFTVMETMVRGNFHRLALIDPTIGVNRFTGIITQSMLISWLRQNKSILGNLRDLRVRDMIEDPFEEVCTVNESAIAINAFRMMADRNVSGLAVVNDLGELTAGISIRDLRAVGTGGEYFFRLFRTIKEFKRLAREEFPKLAPRTHYSRKLTPRKGRLVTRDQTFVDVLDKMDDGNLHRVFVCDSFDRPIPLSVISQVDVLRVVLEHLIKTAEVGYTIV